jgi:exosortase H (IPTLxxWG-CTERM-specific)
VAVPKSNEADRKQAVSARPAGNTLPRFAITFGVCLLAGFGALLLPAVQAVDGSLTKSLVQIAQSLIHACGGRASAAGAILLAPNGFGVEMKDGCNAANVTILFWAALIAFPAGHWMKMVGALTGALLIQAVNILRFISLFYLRQYNSSLFDFAHNYLWETLIILDTLVIFWWWVNWVNRGTAAASPQISGA